MPENKCIIAVDAMGGDCAPRNVVLGAVEACKENSNIEVLLVGKKEEILQELGKIKNHNFPLENIVDTREVIEMHDKPADAVKNKKDSSIVVGLNLVKEKKANAFVSAGNTGAVMAASTLILGRVKGCSRPTIGTYMPSENGVTTVFDVGANVDCKPINLLEFAIMGSIYVKEIYNIDKPTVGLLSVGEEDTKGNDVSRTAFSMLKDANINFFGNVEGRDITKGTVNVVVCDGFVGNIVLKFAEGIYALFKSMFSKAAKSNPLLIPALLLVKFFVRKEYKKFDYQTYGGVPLLGVNGVSIIGHGSSSVKAIKNMILRAYEMYQKDITGKIEKGLMEYINK
jgi:glycerol-3-phosphate acyltransferase PlsX